MVSQKKNQPQRIRRISIKRCCRLAKSVNILYSIAIFISYGLQGYVPVKILWESYIVKHLEGSDHLLAWEYLLRISSVLVTCKIAKYVLKQLLKTYFFLVILAATVPLLGLFISLVGAFCLSALGLAFPALMEICVMWPDKMGPAKIVLWRNLILVIFGVVGLLAGSYSSLSEIVIQLSRGTE